MYPRWILPILLLWCVPTLAQGPGGNIPANTYQTLPSSSPQSHGTGAPTATCSSGNLYTNDSNGTLYSCDAGAWVIPGAPAPNSVGIPAANGNVFYASNYGVKGNTLNLANCSITVSTSALSCVGSNFVATDVGKNIFCSSSGSAAVHPGLDMPNTITAVGSSTAVTVQTNAIGTVTNGQCAYGTDDTSAINTMWTALLAQQNCGTAHFGHGGFMFSSAIMNTNASNCNYGQYATGLAITGEGSSSTIFYPTPNFTFNSTSNCGASSTDCFGPGPALVQDVEIYCGTNAGSLVWNTFNGTFITVTTPGSWLNSQFQECFFNGNAQGLTIASGSAWLINDQFVGFAGNASGGTCTTVKIASPAVYLENIYIATNPACGNAGAAMQVSGGTDSLPNQLNHIFGATALNNSSLFSGGITILHDYAAQLGLDITGGTVRISDTHQKFSSTGVPCGLNVSGGAVVYVNGSDFVNTAASGTENAVCIDATSTVVDGCGNTWSANSGPALFTSGATWTACGGPSGTILINAQLSTATCVASQTLFLFPWGQTATSSCGSATAETQVGGFVAPRAGTLYGLTFASSAGGVAGDKVTVLQNGSASTITCTYATGTSCTDVTHSVAIAKGDLIGFSITTGVADTTTVPKASVVLF